MWKRIVDGVDYVVSLFPGRSRPPTDESIGRQLHNCRRLRLREREAMLRLYTKEHAEKELTALAEKVKHIGFLLQYEEQKESPDQKLLEDLEAQFGAASRAFYEKRDDIFVALGLEFSINPNEYQPKMLQ